MRSHSHNKPQVAGNFSDADLTAVERAILDLLRLRAAQVTICPSEVARSIDATGWRALMPAVREAAARLVARRAIEVTQRGASVDPLTARGPIRLRRVVRELRRGNAGD